MFTIQQKQTLKIIGLILSIIATPIFAIYNIIRLQQITQMSTLDLIGLISGIVLLLSTILNYYFWFQDRKENKKLKYDHNELQKKLYVDEQKLESDFKDVFMIIWNPSGMNYFKKGIPQLK